MKKLIENLRSLAAFRHDDFTIAEEAADLLEQLSAGELPEPDIELALGKAYSEFKVREVIAAMRIKERTIGVGDDKQLEADAARWRWLAGDCDGNEQDDFTRWLSGHVAGKEQIDAKIDEAMRSANVE
jgi:hypothetical protein